MKSSIFSGTNSIHILVLPHMILQAKLMTGQKFINRFQMKYRTTLLTHSSPMHTFPTPENIQKTLRFSDVFRGLGKGALRVLERIGEPYYIINLLLILFFKYKSNFQFSYDKLFFGTRQKNMGCLQISLLTLQEFW